MWERQVNFNLKQFKFERRREWLGDISQPAHGSERAHGSGLDSY